MQKIFEDLTNLGVEVADSIHRFADNEKIYLKYVLLFPTDKNFENLEIALSKKDYPAAIIAVHTLKGLSLNLGFLSLADLSMDLQDALKNDSFEEIQPLFEELKKQYNIYCDVISKA
jgi:hypothetical protein